MINKLKKLKTKFIRYWLGEVAVSKYYIGCSDKKNRLHTISIIPSRFRKATWFSDVDVNTITEIIEKLEQRNKYFQLRINHDCNIFQEYTFGRYQQKLLLAELNKIVAEEEFYVDGKEY